MKIQIKESASVSDSATLGADCQVWDFAQIRENCFIGGNTIVGSYVYIDSGVRLGKNCKIQNGAKIYAPAEISDGVFIGPGAILTNDHNPRAINSDETRKSESDWIKSGVHIGLGASIGAGSVCVAPLTIGKWALIGAGSVVIRDVLAHEVVAGNPARHLGWVGPAGVILEEVGEGTFQCPETKSKFILVEGKLEGCEKK